MLVHSSSLSRTTSEEYEGASSCDEAIRGYDVEEPSSMETTPSHGHLPGFKGSDPSSQSTETTVVEASPVSSFSPTSPCTPSKEAAFVHVPQKRHWSADNRPTKKPRTDFLPPGPGEVDSPSVNEPKPRHQSRDIDNTQPFVVAYNKNFQRLVDAKGLSFGVQFEIARLVTAGRYDWGNIPLLDDLKGPNNPNARKTASVLTRSEKGDAAFEAELAGKLPWGELDREELELAQNPFSGLGYNSDGKRKDWYGGKVHFRGKYQVQEDTTQKKPTIVLERAELGSSSLLTRRYGSKNFMRIKVPKRFWHSGTIKNFFRRPLIVMGSVYRAYWAHDFNIYLLRTDEVYDVLGNRVYKSEDSTGISYIGLFKMFNPLEFNSSQTMAKWSSRVQLGCSNSVPGMLLKEEQIDFIPDIVSSEQSDMTDGCGFCSRSILSSLYSLFEWPTFPSAIQCRVAGCKGLLIEKPDDRENEPWLWLRYSQRKIKYADMDPSLLSIDVLRSSRLKTPARLNYEVIINLHENGVKQDAFEVLIKKSVRDCVQPFLDWEGPDAMTNLWRAVARAGGVMQARKMRAAGGESRAKGYGEHISDDEDEDEDENELEGFDSATHYRSEAWYPDRTSGQPSSLEETVMGLLDSDFDPQGCLILREKLQAVIRRAVESQIRKCRIEVQKSLTAFIVPDPYGVLEPGQVYIRSSSHNIIAPVDGARTDQVLGDVLVTRSPCKLPTDVQKWVAVDKPELRHLKDVIVMSVKGPRRPADYLGGGDYDGDKCLVIWDPIIVGPFTNADISFATEPLGLAEDFQTANVKATEFLEKLSSAQNDQEQIGLLQDHLLGVLDTPSTVGEYDTFFVHSLYQNGYFHKATKRLAYIFCKVLDGAKTGLRVREDILKADRAMYGKTKGPEWHCLMIQDERGSRQPYHDTSNRPFLNRGSELNAFIMDQIRSVLKKEQSIAIKELKDKFGSYDDHMLDKDLVEPWTNAERRGKLLSERGEMTLANELVKIAKHVEDMYERHLVERGKGSSPRPSTNSSSPSKKKNTFTGRDIVWRQDVLRTLSREFHASPDPEQLVALSANEVLILRASYAYKYATGKNPKTRFCWDMSFRELCEIKAKTLGKATNRSWKTISTQFYEHFSIKS